MSSSVLKITSSLTFITLMSLTAACNAADQAASPAAQDGAARTAAVPANGKDWSQMVAWTDEGGLLVGRPDAKVKLVEYGSYTCPHCAVFANEDVPKLIETYVKPGSASLEFRSFPLNGIDVAISLLQMCQKPEAAWTIAHKLYATQKSWIEPFRKVTPESYQQISKSPVDKQVLEFARLGGFQELFKNWGVTKGKFEQCLSDPKALDKFSTQAHDAQKKYKIMGTPSFFLNDKPLNGVRLEAWESDLKSALK